MKTRLFEWFKHDFRLFGTLIFIFVFVFGLRGVYGDDIWFHLSTGRYIAENHYIPVKDVFSFSAYGMDWLNQNWLSDLIFYVIQKFFGQIGLGIFFTLSVFALMLFVYKAALSLNRNKVFALCGVFLVSYFATSRFQARPETGSYLFASFIIYLLFSKNKLAKVLIPLIFLIWANWQAGFVPFGLFILGSYVFYTFIRNIHKGDINYAIKSNMSNITVFIICVIFSLLNPLKLKGLLYFIGVQPKYLVEDFTEWGSLMRILEMQRNIFRDMDFGFLFLGYLFFVIIFIYIIYYLFNRLETGWAKRILDENGWIILTFIFVFLPFFAYRLIPFSIIALYLISSYLIGISESKKTFKKKGYIGLLSVVILMAVVRIIAVKPVFILQDRSLAYRREVIDFLRNYNIKGNMFNPLEDGGYFIWAMPERKVFIDQRLDVYTASGIYEEYRKVYSFPPKEDWQEVLDKYDIQYILLPGWQDEPLKTIMASGKYGLVYWSDFFFLLIKTDGVNKDYFEANKIDNFKPFKSEEYKKEELALAIKDAETLKGRSPISANILVSLGDLYKQNGEVSYAIESLLKSLEINNKDDKAKLFLGSLYVEDKQCDMGLKYFGQVSRKGTTVAEATAYWNMANVYFDCLGDITLAYKYYAKFLKVGTKVGVDPKLLDEAYFKMQQIRGSIN